MEQFKPKPIIALRGYTRSGSFPLDDTSFFDNYPEAIEYVRTSPIVYPGQIISVDDPMRSKVRVYKVEYDTDPSAIYKYRLEEIAVGSSTLGQFNFKGKLDSYEDLLNISNPVYNDLYYVNQNGSYIAYVYVNKEWTQIDLGIGFASKSSDGIISKELYRKLSGRTSAGIYYHPGINETEITENRDAIPEDASFIELETIGPEDKKKIQTADKLKETIYNIMEVEPPKAEIVLNYNISEMYANQVLHDVECQIYLYPRLGGNISTGSFYTTFVDENNKPIYPYGVDTVKILNPSDFSYDKNKKRLP